MAEGRTAQVMLQIKVASETKAIAITESELEKLKGIAAQTGVALENLFEPAQNGAQNFAGEVTRAEAMLKGGFVRSIAQATGAVQVFDRAMETAADEEDRQRFARLAQQAQVLRASMQTATGAAGRKQMAVQQLGYAMNDAAMFAVDFRAGIMGISNQVPIIASAMGMGAGAVAALTGGLTALVFLAPMIEKFFEGGAEDAELMTDALRDQRRETEELIATLDTLSGSELASQASADHRAQMVAEAELERLQKQLEEVEASTPYRLSKPARNVRERIENTVESTFTVRTDDGDKVLNREEALLEIREQVRAREAEIEAIKSRQKVVDEAASGNLQSDLDKLDEKITKLSEVRVLSTEQEKELNRLVAERDRIEETLERRRGEDRKKPKPKPEKWDAPVSPGLDRPELAGTFEGLNLSLDGLEGPLTGDLAGVAAQARAAFQEMTPEMIAELERLAEANRGAVESMTGDWTGFVVNNEQAIQDNLFVMAEAIGMLGDLWANQHRARMDEIAMERDAELSRIDDQLAAESLSEAQRKKLLEQRAAAEEKYRQMELKERQKQAKRDKSIALFEVAINTASAVAEALPNIPLSVAVGVLGALQAGVILSTPEPKFARGGRIKGPGGPTDDLVPIMASNGEFMVRAAAYSAAPQLVERINRDPAFARQMEMAVASPAGREPHLEYLARAADRAPAPSQAAVFDDSRIVRAVGSLYGKLDQLGDRMEQMEFTVGVDRLTPVQQRSASVARRMGLEG